MYSVQIREAQDRLINDGDAIEHKGYYIGPRLNIRYKPVDFDKYYLYTYGGDYLHGSFDSLDEAKRHADEMHEMLC